MKRVRLHVCWQLVLFFVVLLGAGQIIGCGPKPNPNEKVSESTTDVEKPGSQESTSQADASNSDAGDESVAGDGGVVGEGNSDGDDPNQDGDFIDLSITSLAATAQDKAFGKSEQFYLNHPITVRLSAQTNEVLTEPLTIGVFLVQKRASKEQTMENTVSCFLGSMTFALFPKAKEDVSLVKKFTIPEECLTGLDGKKQDKATFNLAIDPYIALRKEYGKEDTQAGLIVFGEGWAGKGVAECKNVDSSKVSFGCVEEFSVERPKESNKLDFVVDDFSVNSNVMVLVNRTKHPDALKEEQFDSDVSINLTYQMRGSSGSKGVSHNPVTLHYEVCAYKVYNCEDPSSWWPLSVYQRKSGSPNAFVPQILIKNSSPNTELFVSHGLFAAGDTLTNIKAVKDFRYILRATLNRGDKQNPRVGELPTHALGEDNDNNFLEKKILIVIPNNAPQEAPKAPKLYTFGKKFEETEGNTKVLGFEREFNTEHKLSTWGISSETYIKSELKGWVSNERYFYAGYSAILAPGLTPPTFGFKAEVVWLDATLWEKSFGNQSFEWEPKEEIEWSKSKEWKKRYWAKVVPIDIVLAFTARIGIDEPKIEFETKLESGSNKPFPKGTLELKAEAKPLAGAEVSLSGSVNIIRYRGGIKATVTLIELSVPVKAIICATKYTNESLRTFGRIEVKGAISTLNGDVSLFVEKRPLKWKKKWFVRIPYFGDWEEWKTFKLFEWEGKKWETTLLNRAAFYDIKGLGDVPEPKPDIKKYKTFE